MSIILEHIKHKFYVVLFTFQSSMYPTQPSLRQALCVPYPTCLHLSNTLELQKLKNPGCPDRTTLLCLFPPLLSSLAKSSKKKKNVCWSNE